MAAKETSMHKLANLLKKHELLIDKCPEVIEIIEDLYVEIERIQIVDAFDTGAYEYNRMKYIDGRDYYKKTYGNKR